MRRVAEKITASTQPPSDTDDERYSLDTPEKVHLWINSLSATDRAPKNEPIPVYVVEKIKR